MTAAVALSIHVCSLQKLLNCLPGPPCPVGPLRYFLSHSYFPLVVSTQKLPRQTRQNLPELTIVLESVHQSGSVSGPKGS